MYHFSFVDFALLLAIADEQHLTRGAQRVFLSPSSASARLKNLEEELGVTLFNREAKGLTLTRAGTIVYRYAKEHSLQMKEMAKELAPYAQKAQDIVRIVANYSAAIEALPKDLTSFMVQYPQVRIELEQMTSPDVIDAVRTGKADFGVGVMEGEYPELTDLPYRDDRLVLIVPAEEHPLSNRKAIYFKEALAYEFVALTRESAMQQFVYSRAKELGHVIEPRIQVDNQFLLADWVKAGVGIAVLGRSAFMHQTAKGVQALELKDEWAERNRSIIRPKDEGELSDWALKLIDHLVQTPK